MIFHMDVDTCMFLCVCIFTVVAGSVRLGSIFAFLLHCIALRGMRWFYSARMLSPYLSLVFVLRGGLFSCSRTGARVLADMW